MAQPEPHPLPTPAPVGSAAVPSAPLTLAEHAGPAPATSTRRARLTAEGLFEVLVEPNDDVAGVIVALRQLPAAARFLEALGDVETTLVFTAAPPPTHSSGRLGDLVPFAYAVPTGPAGRELVGLTANDLADRLRTTLAEVPLGPQDERVLAWLAAQPADRALTISSLLLRARTHAA